MRRLALVVGFAVLGLTACTRGGLPPERVQAWVGRSAGDLVREWGPPTRETDDAGQRLLIYDEMERTQYLPFEKQVSARQVGSAAAAQAANAAVQGPQSYARSYHFWVDAAGSIVRAQTRQP